MNMNKKLLVNEWFKEYEIISVSKECFNNSPEIETAGTTTGFKIHNQENLNFRVKYLKSLGFKVVV